MAERATAKRLFMIVQQMVKYVDADTPVRFLIAETEAGFTFFRNLQRLLQEHSTSCHPFSLVLENAEKCFACN